MGLLAEFVVELLIGLFDRDPRRAWSRRRGIWTGVVLVLLVGLVVGFVWWRNR